MSDTADPADDRDVRIGSLALRAKMVTPEQLREALSQQAREATEGKSPRQLGTILCAMGYLTRMQLATLLAEQLRKRTRLGLP